jgi:hypothetical protein
VQTHRGGAEDAARESKIDDAMDNLVAVMSSDKFQLETLAASNTSLVAINVENATAIAEITRQNSQLLSLLKSMNCRPVGGGEQYNQDRSSRFRKPRGCNNEDSKFNGDRYWWTHGYLCHIGHSSATCRSENPGHKKASTHKNTMGCSVANKDWVKAKWRYEPGEIKYDAINYISIMNQITKKFAWNKPLNVDDTAFIDSAASLTLLHNRAPADDAATQQKQKQKQLQYRMVLKCTQQKPSNYGSNSRKRRKLATECQKSLTTSFPRQHYAMLDAK